MKQMELLDSLIVRFALTLAVAYLGGRLAMRLKVPVGGLIGGLIGVMALNMLTGKAYAPAMLRAVVQSLSGAYIGVKIRRSDIPAFRVVLAPAAIMVAALLVFNVGLGVIIGSLTDMTFITALLSTTPGGLTEITLMSVEMGANQAQVTLMHLLRLTAVLGLFPMMLRKMAARFGGEGDDAHPEDHPEAGQGEKGDTAQRSVIKTVAISLAAGALGNMTGLPAGALAFSMVAVAAFNIKSGEAYIPPRSRSYVQMLAGLIIGKGVTLADVMSIPDVLMPAVLMIACYFALNVGLSLLISRYTKMTYTTASLSTSPAGASDMALIAMELGGDAPKVACMQMIRMFATILVFPPVIQLVVGLLGG